MSVSQLYSLPLLLSVGITFVFCFCTGSYIHFVLHRSVLRLPYDSSGRARISSLSIDFVWLYGKNSQQFIQASSTGSKHLAPAEYSSRRDEIKNDDRAHCKIVCCTNSLSDALNSIGCESVYNCPVLRHTELLHSERPEYARVAHCTPTLTRPISLGNARAHSMPYVHLWLRLPRNCRQSERNTERTRRTNTE